MNFGCICKSCKRAKWSREHVFSSPELHAVLVSYCYSNKLSQISCLKTTRIYYLTILEVRCMKWIWLGNIKVLGRLFLSGGSRGELVFYFFQLLEAITLLDSRASSIFKANWAVESAHITSFWHCLICFLLPHLRILWLQWTYWIIQGNLPILRSVD